MKNLKKMVAILAASATMLAVVPAFADAQTITFTGGNGAVTGSFNDATNTVTATVDVSKSIENTEMTFLILNKNVTDQKIAEGIDASDVLYIDQKTLTSSSNQFVGPINLNLVTGISEGATALPEGTYPIRLGLAYDNDGTQDFALAKGAIVVSSKSKTVTIVWGDANINGEADLADAMALVSASAKHTGSWTKTINDEQYTFTFNSNVVTVGGKSYNMVMPNSSTACYWGDVNVNGEADLADAMALVSASAKHTGSWFDGAAGFNNNVLLTLTEAK